jgi:hypothetical protein
MRTPGSAVSIICKFVFPATVVVLDMRFVVLMF